jgi:hypothetical protein
VGGADEGPFASDLVEAPEQELPEASGLLDLAEDRLDDLLAQAVARASAGALQRRGHRAHPGAVPEAPVAGGVVIAMPGSAGR